MARRVFSTLIIGSLATLVLGCSNARENQGEAPVPTAPAINTPTGPGAADVNAPQDYTETRSGLKYRILRKGKGEKPTDRDTVRVHYKGTLDDGTEFDSSYKGGEPIEFPLRGVIPGWTEGLQYVAEGGMIELEIPGDMAYGSRPPPGSGIPPNATLHFTVELLDVL